MAYILGIETSCDETAAAVYDTNTKRILSSQLHSQVELHEIYGGVVPEVASRSHIEKIHEIVTAALDEANLAIEDINAVAVTSTPGLAGSLLVGFSFAKALAYACKIPLIRVNHLQGHIFSAYLTADGYYEQVLPYPHVCLSASGGHTALYIVENAGIYHPLGNTLDDAVGEAFDKIAKLLELGYPGGPLIEKRAEKAGYKDYFSYSRTKKKKGCYDFSFSGLKTAIFYDMVRRGYAHPTTQALTSSCTDEVKDMIASSMLVCVGDILSRMLEQVLADIGSLKGFSFVGGVACNRYLRKRLQEVCDKRKIPFTISQQRFCTDNAAMIALVGAHKYLEKLFAPLDSDIFAD